MGWRGWAFLGDVRGSCCVVGWGITFDLSIIVARKFDKGSGFIFVKLFGPDWQQGHRGGEMVVWVVQRVLVAQ